MRGLRGVAAAAVLAAALPVPSTAAPGQDRAARLREWAARRQRTVEHLARRLPVDPALVAAAKTEPSGLPYHYGTLIPAGDLDRAGGTDFVDVRVRVTADPVTGEPRETVRADARRGRDGKLLWSAPVTGTAVATTVGAAGGPGLLTVAVTDSDGPLDPYLRPPQPATTTFAEYDARGRRLWETTVPGGPSDHPGRGAVPPYHTRVFTDAVGLGDVIPGGGLDIVVVTVTQTVLRAPEPLDRVESEARLGVIDAATGTYAALGEPVPGETANVWAAVVGDLDGVRGADVTVATTVEGRRRLTAVGGRSGKTLWAARSIPHTHEWHTTPLPDVTGDGRADVAVAATFVGGSIEFNGESADPSGEPGDPAWAKVALLDGKDGRVVWTRPGQHVVAVGDLDRRRGAEVVTAYDFYSDRLRAAAYNAAGRALWSVSLPNRLPDAEEDDSAAFWHVVGDTDGDGRRDLSWAVRDTGTDPWRKATGVVNTRTGRNRPDPVADTRHLSLAIDGRGADGVHVKTHEGRGDAFYATTVTAWRGDRAARLWRLRFDARDLAPSLLGLVPADRDRCADLLVGDAFNGQLVLFSGATGRPLWGMLRGADGSTRITAKLPRGLRVTTYARSC